MIKKQLDPVNKKCFFLAKDQDGNYQCNALTCISCKNCKFFKNKNDTAEVIKLLVHLDLEPMYLRSK